MSLLHWGIAKEKYIM
uniref:Uncharacterized protein n=1 Tax=Arundo donax TaxID=35708 RepID=A0A0A9AQR0_ARUDO